MPVRSVSRASFPCQESGAFEATPLRNGAFSTALRGRRVRKLRMLRPFCPKFLFISLALLLALPLTSLAARQRAPHLSLETVNAAEWQGQGKPSTPLLVKLQVLLDRAHASPGEKYAKGH